MKQSTRARRYGLRAVPCDYQQRDRITGSSRIRDNYLRLINKAQKSIYIQTPYFIPDEAVFNALLIAIRSGIEVNIMIPCKPDHPFVYWATYSYIGDMVMAEPGAILMRTDFCTARAWW